MNKRADFHGVCIQSNGQFITTFHNNLAFGKTLWYAGNQISEHDILVTKEFPVVEIKNTVEITKKYVPTVEGQPEMEPDMYLQKTQLLREKMVDGEWQTQNDRLAWLTHSEFYIPIKNSELVTVGTVAIAAEGEYQKSPNDFIVMARHFGDDISSQIAKYKRVDYILAEAARQCHDLGLTESSSISGPVGTYHIWYNSSWTEIILRVSGNKVFEVKAGNVTDTLDICVEKQNQDKDFIATKIKSHLAAEQKKLENVGNEVRFLNSLAVVIKKIDSKIATHEFKRQALNLITGHIEKLQFYIENNEDDHADSC